MQKPRRHKAHVKAHGAFTSLPVPQCQQHCHVPPAVHTHITVLQGLVLLRHLQEDLLKCGVHQPKTGEVKFLQTLLQVLWKGNH